jgi:8-hydroxy-5-deazaflavin:NADPH oxidoreductase
MSSATKVKIGILGAGNMGRALGLRFALLGHGVFFGGRNPNEAPLRAAELANTSASLPIPAKSGTLDAAADFGDVLIWTIRERDPHNVLSDAGARALDGKIILDPNNRDYASEVLSTEARWFDRSLGEKLQDYLPNARVLKAFNTIPMESLDTSAEVVRGAGAQVCIAGGKNGGADEEGKRKAVVNLIEELGFQVMDLGTSATSMRVAEAMGDVVRFIMIDGGVGPGANLGIRTMPEPDLGIVGGREPSAYH